MAEIPAYPAFTPDDLNRISANLRALTEADATLRDLRSRSEIDTVVSQPADAIEWPPGAAGSLAQLLFQNVIRPVKEVAVATALAFLAGICGKGWNTHTGAGLNLYIILVARSGIGKEAIGDGISALIASASKHASMCASDFFTFDAIASGPALVKVMQEKTSILHVSGEFGHNVRLMAVDKNGPHATLRQQMTKLYSKSGAASIAGGITYSDAANSARIDGSVSYSLIGETTPGTFFEALNGSMMSDGFMSRFLIVDYDGIRPPQNECRLMPDGAWSKWLGSLAETARHKAFAQPTPVVPDGDANFLLREFSEECDTNINATEDETRRQMWNRAHLKALKVAALLAVADNAHVPGITVEQARWAVDLVRRDIRGMTRRLDSGDIGESDDARRRQVLACMRDWMTKGLSPSYRRKSWPEMQENSIMPRAYLTIRLHSAASFNNHRLGRDAAMDLTVASLVRDGCLMEVQKDKLLEGYAFHGVAYRILRTE